ncbi:prolipoprotein diacylglyceryl transferase, partial [Acetobacter sp. DmW_125123]
PGGITMGQLLCCPMLAAGIALMVYANRHPVYEGIPPEAEAKP